MKIRSSFEELPGDKATIPTVLIVDDEPITRSLFEFSLKSEIMAGHIKLLSCQTVPSAIEILSTTEVHAIVLDRHLGDDEKNPDHDGVASIPKLKTARPHAQI